MCDYDPSVVLSQWFYIKQVMGIIVVIDVRELYRNVDR